MARSRARASGSSATLAFVGEPGIGKTVLLDYAAERAGDMQVLRARGIETEAQVPFGSLLELLRPALVMIDRIPAPQAVALESALALRPGQAQERFAVGAATLSLLAAYAEQGPLAILIDDAHWLDDSSAQALLFAVPPADRRPDRGDPLRPGGEARPCSTAPTYRPCHSAGLTQRRLRGAAVPASRPS